MNGSGTVRVVDRMASARGARAGALLVAALLGGCAWLPSSGPTKNEILKSENDPKQNPMGFRIVTVDADIVRVAGQVPVVVPPVLPGLPRGGPGTVGPGDMLQVSVFEVGSGLFGGSNTANAEQAPDQLGTTAARHTLPDLMVDAAGSITVPYIGRLRVAGRTPQQIQDMIQAGLRAKSQDPQVIVTPLQSVASTVIVSGDVAKPGRIPLTFGRERLSDAIALAGGPRNPAQDETAQLTRGGAVYALPLAPILARPEQDPALQVQDRIQLVYERRSYTVFGAPGKVAEEPLVAANVTLAEAAARAGGPNPNTADPTALFLFRLEQPSVVKALNLAPLPPGKDGVVNVPLPFGSDPVPIVYRLDLNRATGYFLARQFEVRNKDIIYLANSQSDSLGKFLGLANTIFLPLLIGRQVAP